MITLFLSDLHLGSPLFESTDEIIFLLRTQKYKQIIIVGDILDEWEDDITCIVKNNEKLLREINKLNNVVIIKGNHDPSIQILKTIFYKRNIADKYELDLDGKKTLIIHGSEFDFMVTKYYWLAKLLFPIHWLLERFGINLKGWFRNTYGSIANKRNKKYYNKLVLNMEKELVEKYRNDYDYIIVGHTHMPKIVQLSDCKYINCGDWIHNRTYVLYDNGNFVLEGEKNVI